MEAMRKPVFPRIFGLLAFYFAVFIVLVIIQFAREGGFTYRVGDLVVSGRYQKDADPLNPQEYALSGKVSVFFGGMEFYLGSDEGNKGGLDLSVQGSRSLIYPEYMVLSGETVLFRFSGGTELAFTTQYSGGAPELKINGVFSEDSAELALPYKPFRSSKIQDQGGQFIVAAGGVNYTFGRSPLDRERQVIVLGSENPAVSYRAVPDQRNFNPGDFTLPQALDRGQYEAALTQWRDRSFSLWNRTITRNAGDEDMVIAYAGEAVRRGVYKAAVAAVPGAFLNGSQRTYVSSVFLGRMDQSLRSLTAIEREKSSRLSRMINERSPELLKEPQVFAYLGVRGYGTFIDDALELVRSIDPAALSIDLTPGILEGWEYWTSYQAGRENPFERLIDQACFVISGGVRRENEGIFVFQGNGANLEFNARLGNALILYGEKAGRDEWAALGRSLVLSVLSLFDGSLLAPEALVISESGALERTEETRLSSARLYRTLQPDEYYPRAVSIGVVNGVWAWTAAAVQGELRENDVLDISVSFPVGETHYMLIRGIRPFAKIQLYNIDYRTDPQFERYDSSGWSYSASEQTLLLKMKHQASVEHIRIYPL
jgi:hypothetical protein